MKYEYGKHVKANIGGKVVLAHLVGAAHDVQGASGPEQKFGVQGPDGDVVQMAYTSSDNELGGGFFTDA